MLSFNLIPYLVILKLVYADIGYFWHVTDFHWDNTYMQQDLSCNNVVKTHGIFGDYWCDSPWRLINSSVYAMGTLKPDADFILWTGDNTLHTTNDNVNFEIHDAILGNITNLLKEVFPNVPVYATLGNHDYFPHNQFPVHGNKLYNSSFQRWKSWIGDDTIDTFLKGAYYTLKTRTGLRIVGLNTNLYYTRNKLVNNTFVDPADQFSWLEDTLQIARTANEKVLITGHISPGIIPTEPNPWMYEYFNTRLNGLIMDYADIIVGMHFGHEHNDNFRVYYDKLGTGVVAQFNAPSITPWRHIIPHETGPAHNPSIRLLKYDRTTSTLLDFTQYYMNLPEVNANNRSEWKFEYNATSAYGLSDLSPSAMAGLVKRMSNRTGWEFQLFRKFWTVSVDEIYQEKCDKKCHAQFYCNFRHLNTHEFVACVTKMMSVSTAPTINSGTISIVTVCTIIFVLFDL